MRIVTELTPVTLGSTLTLPLQYNSQIQGLIYRSLDRAISDWIHDEGLAFGKRRFKFFTFSRLFGPYRIQDGTIAFSAPIRLHIGSVHQEMLQSLAEHLLREPVVYLGRQRCEIRSIAVEPLPGVSRPVLVRTLSPITIYSTLTTADGRKKTYYYSPFEGEWEEQLLANLRRKALALGWDKVRLSGLEDGKAHIRPVRVGKHDLRVLKYRETVIKAWTGVYELDLPEPFFLLAYDAGLGAKNSQGFGMVEVVAA